jgi:hypothetical protein
VSRRFDSATVGKKNPSLPQELFEYAFVNRGLGHPHIPLGLALPEFVVALVQQSQRVGHSNPVRAPKFIQHVAPSTFDVTRGARHSDMPWRKNHMVLCCQEAIEREGLIHKLRYRPAAHIDGDLQRVSDLG